MVLKAHRMKGWALLLLGLAACHGGDGENRRSAESSSDSGMHDAAPFSSASDAATSRDMDAQSGSDSDAGGDSGLVPVPDAAEVQCKNVADCEDNDVCTHDSCGAEGLCVWIYNEATCNDGDACTLDDRCKLGACVGTATCGGACATACPATPAVVPLAAGTERTCARRDDGSIRCWGDSWAGALGCPLGGKSGADLYWSNPELPGKVRQVALGSAFGCALLESGVVHCWGTGADGALGNGTNATVCGDLDDPEDTPANALPVQLGGSATHIAAGFRHACAALADGTVRCWGYSKEGELGYARGLTLTIGSKETPAQAGPVDVGGHALRVAAGDIHSCALLEGGTVRCWGFGVMAGAYESIGDDEKPASWPVVDLGGKAVDVVAGRYHTCALLVDGSVRCWGAQGGMLGYANDEAVGDDETPAEMGPVSLGGKAVQLSASDDHTCAILEDKTLRCWGINPYGQLGYGNKNNIGDNETPASAGAVNVGGPVRYVVTGYSHTCALLESGALRCWGRGGERALGYGGLGTVHADIGDNETPASAGDVSWNVATP